MAPPIALHIRDLRVRYPGADRPALDGVTLSVKRGEFVAVAGPNGSGKSTLALTAAGLVPRVVRADIQGRVEVDGAAVSGSGLVPASARAGLVLTDPSTGLSGARATVREELAFGLENLGVARDAMDERIEQAAAALGIEHLADRAPETLSGGEQQRVAIAAALAMEQPLLVLDEATAELDPWAAESLAEELARLADTGLAVLATEHAQVMLDRSDRSVILDAGRVVTERPVTTPVEVSWEPVARRPGAGVEIRDLVYRYPGGPEAVRGVDLAIAPGEAVAVVGANGSGKSTLAKHLLGLLRPSSGRVALDGRDMRQVSVETAARSVGFLFQDPREQLFGRTVEAAVAFGPRSLGLPYDDVGRLVAAALDALGLRDQAASNPHDLDPARRKLVALAGALAMDPALVVLDEPSTGQDQSGIERVGAVIDALRAAGRTVVAITHDLELAVGHFGRVVALRAGEMIADGPATEVMERALN
jgi:energy-coupling factor transporter ATP-binding protein EcfA2